MTRDLLPLDQLLARQAERIPRRTYIKFEGKRYTFREMDRLASAFSAFLRQQGAKRGDRVALLSCNCHWYVAAYFGIIRSGCVVLPINNLLTHEEVGFILKDAGVFLVFHDAECTSTVDKLRQSGHRFAGFAEAVREGASAPASAFPPTAVDDVSTILYTSGTTGRPKGALLTHRNIAANALAALDAIHITQKDRFIVFLPLFHSFTYTVCVVLPLITGSLISLLPGVRPFQRVVKSLIVDRITLFVAIPTVYKILAEKNMPWFVKLLLNLRLCISGAAPLPPKVIREFEAAFKVPLREGYGLTEASPVVSFNRIEVDRQKPGTVGLPLPGISVRTIGEDGKDVPSGTPGELLVRGPNVMRGYLNRPEDTAATVVDGWLHTGDIAALDDEGFIKIIDRKKDLIIVDGLNVYPYEVEEVLYRHPAIQDCSMIGVPHEHEEGKELGIMYVVLKEGAAATAKELRDYLAQHVAHYKIPRRFIFSSEMPRTATGKIMKKELRNWYRDNESKRS
ncbi:MAG: long-chain fatty acid--CoA ligase [Nitrospiraceae bacterium]|nr:long-chain fatty acid--CoA ligase [Nitrospiraceae bacterium]